MSAGAWFWILYVICVVFGTWADWPADGRLRPLGGRLAVFILLGLLGYRVFGSPLQ